MFFKGIIIHLIFLYSIFDIYFKSPIVQNVSPYQPQHDAVADRLVLFVVDGLRAESFVNYTTMKYLRPTVSILYEDLLQGSRRDHASPTADLRALWRAALCARAVGSTGGRGDGGAATYCCDCPLKQIFVQDRNCWPKADENKMANSKGRWGISNTQVPTESRPGHVALIAGFYEDPSAVFRGWKENPVDFDSVFNRTKYTWSWGTYDIVNIFTKGMKDNHIIVEDFDPYENSFSSDKNTTHLDAWVFGKVKIFFERAKRDDSIKEKLSSDKIVFFLHLLGTDTSGHTHKPKTQNFLTTLAHVDEGIQEIEKVIREYYGDDGKTTFLMTSDHGMTDWGSHGSGDNHETETPYVIWGSGIKTAQQTSIDSETLDLSKENRLDINQVDLAPLMSTILSIPVPVNSIGRPIDGLMDMTVQNKAKSLYSVSRQLASQYDKKRQDVEANALPLLYYPFEPFTKNKHREIMMFTEQLLKDQNYEELIVFSNEIVDLSIAGLRYYHDYYQRPLLVLVTLSFLGWAACLLKVLTTQKASTQGLNAYMSRKEQNVKLFIDVFYISLCIVGVYLVYVQSLPIQYNIYILLPLYLWWSALSPFNVWLQTMNQLKRNAHLYVIFVEIISYTVGCLALGMSFTYRWTLSIPLLGMGLWPILSSTKKRLPRKLVTAWSLGCLVLSVFSFIPVVGKETFISLVILAGLIWLVLLIVHMKLILMPLMNKGESRRDLILSVIQMAMLSVSLQNIYVQSKRFQNGTPVSYFDQTVAWIIAVIAPTLPMLFYNKLASRLVAIDTALLSFYLLVSVAHEGLFMVAMTSHVMCWLIMEHRLLNNTSVELIAYTFRSNEAKQTYARDISVERSINNQDFRRAFFFVSYIILAFFGTGNIASLNSFEVRWVTCFVTSFHPFLITTLILLKTFAPFMVVGCGFVAVQTLTEAPMGCLNIIVLIYSNLMGIQLLYNVRNTGSWLEIGTSISQFVIVQLITVFIVIINKIAKLYTDNSIAGNIFKSRKKYI